MKRKLNENENGNENENENRNNLIQLEINTVTTRAAPGDLGLKSNPKDYQQKLTYQYSHPSKYKPRPMLLNLTVRGRSP